MSDIFSLSNVPFVVSLTVLFSIETTADLYQIYIRQDILVKVTNIIYTWSNKDDNMLAHHLSLPFLTLDNMPQYLLVKSNAQQIYIDHMHVT